MTTRTRLSPINKTLTVFLFFLFLQCGNKDAASGGGSSSSPAETSSTPGTVTTLSVDTNFANSSGANNEIAVLHILSNGKIMIGGSFTQYNGVSRSGIARLNSDGSLDTGFDPGTGLNVGDVRAMAIQSDGKIIIGGAFTSYNGAARSYLARILANGQVDTSFDAGPNALRTNTLSLQSDGKILTGTYSNNSGATIKRFNDDGSLDGGFTFSGVNNFAGDGKIHTIAVLSSGKIFFSGDFTTFNNGGNYRGFAGINADGSNNTGFAGEQVYGINSIIVLSSGKLLINSPSDYGSAVCKYIARLNPDGTLDSGFSTTNGADNLIYGVSETVNGKLLLGGEFAQYNGVARNRFAIVNSDGSLDTSFDVGAGPNQYVKIAKAQSDGSIVIVGGFTEYNSVARGRIVRLKP